MCEVTKRSGVTSMVQVSMEDGSLNSWKSLYQKKGYYRKVIFLVLVFMYVASVCGILVLKADSFRTKEGKILTQREGRRVRRSEVLEQQPLSEGTCYSKKILGKFGPGI